MVLLHCLAKNKLKQFILKHEILIKKIEYFRGLYRYPNKMLGRHINTSIGVTDVLVFAAHPDDDVLGLCSTLYRHSLKGDNIKIVFITNGTAGIGESWHLKINESRKKADLRFAEALRALSQINIPKENMYCLGFPDGGTQRYLKEISIDISFLLQKLDPKRVYVHCIEGGHIDHDMSSFVVKSICREIGYSNLFEWTEYNPLQPIGTTNVEFLSIQSDKIEDIVIDISEEERLLKRKMLAFHQSQDVEKYYLQGEAIRRAQIGKPETELLKYSRLSESYLSKVLKKFNTPIYK